MIRFNTPGDINALRRMMMAGDVPEDTIDTMEQTGGMVAVTPPQAQAAQRMRVVGADGSAAHDLGFSDAPAPAVDYGRAPIQIAGVGKGWYAKDGRSAIVTGPGGEKVQVLLGYDKAASDRATDAQIKREAARANIDATREQIEASRSLRNIRETKAGQGPGGVPVYEPGNLGNIWNTGAGGQGGPMVPQALLEKMHGRAPQGMRWKPDGSLEEIPGAQGIGTTEDEKRSAGLAIRMDAALDQMRRTPSGSRPEWGAEMLRAVPVAGETLANLANSAERRTVEAAQMDALDAALTLATGAAYTKEQLKGLSKAYFPQLGDDEKTIADKAQRLERTIETARIRAGRMGGSIDRVMAGQNGRGAAGGVSAPPEAVEYLRRNPSLSAAFDMKYGKGAAAAALGGR